MNVNIIWLSIICIGYLVGVLIVAARLRYIDDTVAQTRDVLMKLEEALVQHMYESEDLRPQEYYNNNKWEV